VNNLTKIFFIALSLLLLLNINAGAQYAEYFKVNDVRGAFVYDIALSKVIDEDVRLLKKNKVKSVIVQSDSVNVMSKFAVNENGWITNYSNYEYNDGEEINYDIAWQNNKLAEVKYKERGMGITYTFNYGEKYLDFIHADFGMGLAEDYIFTYTNSGLIGSIAYDDKSKDTVYMTINFEYNEKDKLTATRHSQYPHALDSVSYENNTVTIARTHWEIKKITLDELRITEEKNIFPSKQLQSRAYSHELRSPDIITTYRYFYKANGLIDYIESGTDGVKHKIIYEYEYYSE